MSRCLVLPQLTGFQSWSNKDLLVEECLPEVIVHLHHGNAMPRLSLKGSKMRTLRKTCESKEIALCRLNPARHTRRWWYHISSEVFGGRDPNSRVRSNSPVHPVEDLLLLISRTRHWERDWQPQGRSLLVQIKQTKIRSVDPVEVRILPVILDGGTLSRQLIRHNSPFTMINTTHMSGSLEERVWSLFSHPPSSPSPSSIWWKEEKTTWQHNMERN